MAFCVCVQDLIETFLLRFSILSSLGEQKLTKADGERDGKSPRMNFATTKVFTTTYRDADKSLARPGRKQSTATEDFEFHISYLSS